MNKKILLHMRSVLKDSKLKGRNDLISFLPLIVGCSVYDAPHCRGRCPHYTAYKFLGYPKITEDAIHLPCLLQ